MLWQFHRVTSRGGTIGFIVVGILLFHTHPIGLVAVGALAAVTFLSPTFHDRRRPMIRAVIVIGVYALPWLLLSRTGYSANVYPLNGAEQVMPRLLQYVVELLSVSPVIGLAVLLAVLWIRHHRLVVVRDGRKTRRVRVPVLTAAERAFAWPAMAVLGAEVIAMAVTHSRLAMWQIGIHHTPELIPITMLLAGLAIAKTASRSRVGWVALMLAFTVTRAAQLAPWTFTAPPRTDLDPQRVVTFHVPSRPLDRLLPPELSYVRSLMQPNPGAVARISQFLRARAAATDVVITNYSWDALYFHTGLPQGMKVASWFPIYPAARGNGLPDYVFSPVDVKWIVWRHAFPASPAQDCARILARLRALGATPRLVASIPDTGSENREDVHFHR
ncbi:MAG: hypothetical protein ACRENC_15320, partial [Gemmatimonadaceae bacterium]